MKQKNRYNNYLDKLAGHELARSKDPKGRAKNIAGCSLHRVDKSRNYENNVSEVIRQLRWKHVIVNDSHQTEEIDVAQDISVEVPPKHVFVGLAKEFGNKTKGKLDFLRSQGFLIFGK